MPVEIRELVIRAITVQDVYESETKPEASEVALNQEAIVQECVRQVMRIIKKKEER